jgi:hypothetical protein
MPDSNSAAAAATAMPAATASARSRQLRRTCTPGRTGMAAMPPLVMISSSPRV